MSTGVFSLLPLWSVFFLTLVIVFAAMYAGLWVGRQSRKKKPDAESPPIGAVVGALFGLLAFMLALTLNATASRYDARKQLLLDEVNAIGTAYLRTDFLEPADRDASKALLRSYVEQRTHIISGAVSIDELITRSEEIQKQLWSIAITYPKGNVQAALTASYIASLNEVFDLHTSRVTVGIRYHVHPVIWLTLLLVSSLSMSAMGYQFGYDGGRRASFCLLLATTFSLILLLIEDLDRPSEGLITVDQAPMVALLKSLSTEVMEVPAPSTM